MHDQRPLHAWKGLPWLLGLFLACLLLPLNAEEKWLTLRDVRPTLEEILSYHVEHRELSPLIVRRALKIFVDYFDPSKTYLLQSELDAFLQPAEEKLERMVRRYYRDDFSDFYALSQLIAHAIVRARGWRAEIVRECIVEPSGDSAPSPLKEDYLHYASSEAELKLRMRNVMRLYLATERQGRSEEQWSPEERERLLLLERQLRKHEESYCHGELQEHFLAVHLLKSFAKSLDAHTSFFTPEEAFEIKMALEKQFEGIGVVLREGIDGVIIADLIEGAPAARSGRLQPHDIIISVDGVSVSTLSYEEVLRRLQNNGRQEVLLGILRPALAAEGSEGASFELSLRREKILLSDERVHASSVPFAGGVIGRIALPSFYESDDGSSCARDLREAIRQLRGKGELLGLVLDLRSNSGGFLSQAIQVASLFISKGIVVISKYAHDQLHYLRDLDGRADYQGPLVILTSRGSASAAEIVAAALQDYGLALIVGDESTYGKGTIQYQTVTDQTATAYFKVTVGKYYTVSGKSTQIEGVKADIVVPTEYARYEVGERYLDYPIQNDQVPAAFVDPLSDVEPNNRWWFQKNYMPYLQQKELLWLQMLPQLRQNSQFRLEHDADFLLFLHSCQAQEPLPTKRGWGSEDLHMGEAVNILKDMLQMRIDAPQKGSS